MSNKMILLLSLIEKGSTCNEICSILNITQRQLFNYITSLTNLGYNIDKKYYENGDIFYYLSDELISKDLSFGSQELLFSSNNIRTLKTMVISDLHFGNVESRLDLVKRVFDYCVKNDIHVIFLCGDSIDGTFSFGEQDIKDVFEQTKYFIKKYPLEKSIITFAVAGNHEKSALKKKGFNFIEAINHSRHDVSISAFSNMIIFVKKDAIQLFHPASKNKKLEYNFETSIALCGHTHSFKIEKIKNVEEMKYEERLRIYVPPVSNILSIFPSALLLTVDFSDKGRIIHSNIQQLYFGQKESIIGEFDYDLTNERAKTLQKTKKEKK